MTAGWQRDRAPVRWLLNSTLSATSSIFIRSITQNWTQGAFYLKLDLANFFVSIDKSILAKLLVKHINEPWWQSLALQILWHDPRQNYELRGNPRHLARVPSHKRLSEQTASHGLPIGNLASQFNANIYLNELDQFVKHELRCPYVRYVDDFVLLHRDAAWLNAAHSPIQTFLADNPSPLLRPILAGSGEGADSGCVRLATALQPPQ